jgi:predicted transposase/invertase (TIGR01784 family)
VELEYAPAELVPDIPLLKNSIVDVRCKGRTGRQFIVEMQMLWTDSFKSRVLFNASKAYVKQLGKGHKYKGLQPVYALNLVNENFERDTDRHYHHYSIIHNELTGKKLEGLEFVFIELPKFKAKNITEKKLQVLWLRYLTEIEDKTENPPSDLLADPAVKEAIDCLRESAFTVDELEAYDRYWDSISSEKTLVSDAHESGLQKGQLIGEAKGIELTLKIIRLHNEGHAIAAIAAAVGLSEKQVVEMLKNAGVI